MALARAVTFEGVDSQRMAELTKEIENDPRPDDVPATEILMLHDEAAKSSLVVLFFDNEDDYAKGDSALNAMETGGHPRSQNVGDEVHSGRPHDRLKNDGFSLTYGEAKALRSRGGNDGQQATAHRFGDRGCGCPRSGGDWSGHREPRLSNDPGSHPDVDGRMLAPTRRRAARRDPCRHVADADYQVWDGWRRTRRVPRIAVGTPISPRRSRWLGAASRSAGCPSARQRARTAGSHRRARHALARQLMRRARRASFLQTRVWKRQ